MRVGIVNPLPNALAHFERALSTSLAPVGELSVSTLAVPATEMPVGTTRLERVRQAFRYLRTARNLARNAEVDLIINIWPAFGYLESLVWSRSSVPVVTILHEVTPLRPQFGYWSRAVPLLRRLTCEHHHWMVHGERAAADARAIGFGDLAIVPHPIMPEAQSGEGASISSDTALVFGQWKPARDLDLLARLGPSIEAIGLRPKIAGRGWPAVEGWQVLDRFVDEEEIAPLLADATVLLLPYAHYYQSGVALRALEAGTGVVGERTAFLEEFFGEDWPGFVTDPEEVCEWVAAIDRLKSLDNDVLTERALSAQRNGTQQWRAVLLAHKPISADYSCKE